jgi:uncharacterized protein (TIGR00369 family)
MAGTGCKQGRKGGGLMTAIQQKNVCFEKNPFLDHLGFEIEQQDKNNILIKLLIGSKHLNINKTLHGGVHAAMLDTIQSLALQTIYQTKVAAINLNVHYLSAIDSGAIYAKARINQQGYKTAAVESEIFDQHDALIAKGAGIYKIIRE